jgi:hypothetical protein
MVKMLKVSLFCFLLTFLAPQENAAPVESTEADHGYSYDILLNRIFSTMKQKNPEMAAGEKRHIVLKPPQVE